MMTSERQSFSQVDIKRNPAGGGRVQLRALMVNLALIQYLIRGLLHFSEKHP